MSSVFVVALLNCFSLLSVMPQEIEERFIHPCTDQTKVFNGDQNELGEVTCEKNPQCCVLKLGSQD